MALDTAGGELFPEGDYQKQLRDQLANLMQLWGLQSQQPAAAGPVAAPATAGVEDPEITRARIGADLFREQMDPEAIRAREQAVAETREPVRFAQEQYQARLARDPWGPGGQFEGRRAADLYSPEAILASQGNTAENQIMRAGGGKQGVIDPEELKRMNAVYAAGRKTYS